MEVKTYNLGDIKDEDLKFAVIFARFKDKYVYVQHKERTTWEIPGGRRELNEPINFTGERELREETGAEKFTIVPIFEYSVKKEQVPINYGRVFYADIETLGALPDLEIGKVGLFDSLPDNLTYPQIQPIIYEEALKILKDNILIDKK